MSFTITGNTMRDGCTNLSSSSATLSLPTGSTVVAAYLYWAGSGNGESTVSLNSQPVTATEYYSDTVSSRSYYSRRADITNRISGSGSFTVSNLSFNTSNTYCSSGRAFGGWAIVAIYEHNSEPLRVVNLFDGFRNFWSNSITLVPNNFVIADSPASKGGKHAHITWEGDIGNSQSNNGSSESLRFNGNLLSDAGNPANNQFNSYSNATGQSTDGVDLDIYNIGSYLSAGATSVSTTYSTGQDRVFLSAEIISVPNQNVADRAIALSSDGTFITGGDVTVTIDVSNNGPSVSTDATVTLPLSNGLAYSGASGSNWNCSASSTQVTCQYSASIADDASASPLLLTLDTSAVTLSSVSVDATVSGSVFDNRSANNSASTTLTFVDPDFSASVKRLIDMNGGNLAPGDTVRFEIELANALNADVDAIEVTDNIPSLISSFSVISAPAGSSVQIQDNPAGSFGQGVITISDITVAANSSELIVIDAVISTNAQNGDVLTNTANIVRGSYQYDATSSSRTVSSSATISQNKPLYLQNDQSLTRVASTNSSSFTEIADSASATWTLSPALQSNMVLDYSQAIPLRLFLRNGYNGYQGEDNNLYDHVITATLYRNRSGNQTAVASSTFSAELVTAGNTSGIQIIREVTTAMMIQNPANLQTGDTLQLTITQSGSNYGDPVDVFFSLNGTPSLVGLTSETVINVETINIADSSAGSNFVNILERDVPAYIQATVSDPFGAYDITAANIVITDPHGNTLQPSVGMTELSASQAEKRYEFAFTPAANAPAGDWRISVIAQEGLEGIVSHSKDAFYNILVYPSLVITRSSEVVSDPLNGSNNPLAIPGATIAMTLAVANTGEGSPDSDTLVITETLAPETSLFIGDLSNGSPIEFVDGPVTSGLTFAFTDLASSTDDLAFSDNGGSTFDYEPDLANGEYDPAITHIQFSPKGTINPGSGSSQPEFRFHYHVKVQ